MLTELVGLNVFSFLLVFARIGAAIMLMPGLGSGIVNVRMRLTFAVMFSFVLTPVLMPLLPSQPPSVGGLFLLLLLEITVGFFFGVITQVMMMALTFAGSTLSLQIGLASALTNDPVTQQQSSIVSSLLSNLGVVLVFVSGLYMMIFHAIDESYIIIPPGITVPLEDLAFAVTRSVGDAFEVGLKLAMPLVIVSLVLFSTLGLLSRLMPQMQIFFIAMPLQILLGLSILMIILPALMLVFLEFFEEHLALFLIQR